MLRPPPPAPVAVVQVYRECITPPVREESYYLRVLQTLGSSFVKQSHILDGDRELAVSQGKALASGISVTERWKEKQAAAHAPRGQLVATRKKIGIIGPRAADEPTERSTSSVRQSAKPGSTESVGQHVGRHSGSCEPAVVKHKECGEAMRTGGIGQSSRGPGIDIESEVEVTHIVGRDSGGSPTGVIGEGKGSKPLACRLLRLWGTVSAAEELVAATFRSMRPNVRTEAERTRLLLQREIEAAILFVGRVSNTESRISHIEGTHGEDAKVKGSIAALTSSVALKKNVDTISDTSRKSGMDGVASSTEANHTSWSSAHYHQLSRGLRTHDEFSPEGLRDTIEGLEGRLHQLVTSLGIPDWAELEEAASPQTSNMYSNYKELLWMAESHDMAFGMDETEKSLVHDRVSTPTLPVSAGQTSSSKPVTAQRPTLRARPSQEIEKGKVRSALATDAGTPFLTETDLAHPMPSTTCPPSQPVTSLQVEESIVSFSVVEDSPQHSKGAAAHLKLLNFMFDALPDIPLDLHYPPGSLGARPVTAPPKTAFYTHGELGKENMRCGRSPGIESYVSSANAAESEENEEVRVRSAHSGRRTSGLSADSHYGGATESDTTALSVASPVDVFRFPPEPSTVPPEVHFLRSDLIDALRRLYHQHNYDMLIEQRRGAAKADEKSEADYIAEMEAKIRNHMKRTAMRAESAEQQEDDLLLSNMGRQRALSSRQVSILSPPGIPAASPRTTIATSPPASIAVPSVTHVPPPLSEPSVEDKLVSPPQVQKESKDKPDTGERVLLREDVDCGLQYTIVGQLSEADTAKARRGTLRETKSKPLRFTKYTLRVTNRQRRSPCMASVRLLKTKLKNLHYHAEHDIPLSGVALKALIPPGATRQLVTFTPAKKKQNVSFQDALLLTGETASAFDTFSSLQPLHRNSSLLSMESNISSTSAFTAAIAPSHEAHAEVQRPRVSSSSLTPGVPKPLPSPKSSGGAKKPVPPLKQGKTATGAGRVTVNATSKAVAPTSSQTRKVSAMTKDRNPPTSSLAGSIREKHDALCSSTTPPPLRLPSLVVAETAGTAGSIQASSFCEARSPTRWGELLQHETEEAIERNLVALAVLQFGSVATPADADESDNRGQCDIEGAASTELDAAIDEVLRMPADAMGAYETEEAAARCLSDLATKTASDFVSVIMRGVAAERELDDTEAEPLPNGSVSRTSSVPPEGCSLPFGAEEITCLRATLHAEEAESVGPSMEDGVGHRRRSSRCSIGVDTAAPAWVVRLNSASMCTERSKSGNPLCASHLESPSLSPVRALIPAPTVVVTSNHSRPLVSAEEAHRYSTSWGVRYDMQNEVGKRSSEPRSQTGSLASLKSVQVLGEDPAKTSLKGTRSASLSNSHIVYDISEVADMTSLVLTKPQDIVVNKNRVTGKISVLAPSDMEVTKQHESGRINRGRKSLSNKRRKHGPGGGMDSNPNHMANEIASFGGKRSHKMNKSVPVDSNSAGFLQARALIKHAMQKCRKVAVGRDAENGRRGMLGAGERLYTGGLTRSLPDAGALTNMSSLEDAVTELYMHDPLRFDAVIDDMMALAAKRLKEGPLVAPQAANSSPMPKMLRENPTSIIPRSHSGVPEGTSKLRGRHSFKGERVPLRTSSVVFSIGEEGQVTQHNNFSRRGLFTKDGDMVSHSTQGDKPYSLTQLGKRDSVPSSITVGTSGDGSQSVNRQTSFVGFCNIEEETNAKGHAVGSGEEEIQQILYEQMKAKLILQCIVSQMRSLWAKKKRQVNEKALEEMRLTYNRATQVAWQFQRRRVINLNKLINLIDRKVYRRKGVWMPYYADDNVIVDSTTNACPRYLKCLPQERLHRAMCLARRSRLLPLRLIRLETQQAWNHHLLYGYRRYELKNESSVYRHGVCDDSQDTTMRLLEHRRLLRRLQQAAPFQHASKMFSPPRQFEVDFPFPRQ